MSEHNKCKCIYCEKLFSNKYTLSTHQKTARFCLKIQKEMGINTSNLYHCHHCDKTYTTNQKLIKHKCKIKKKKDYSKLEKEIININSNNKNCNNTINNNTTNNNIINNYVNLLKTDLTLDKKEMSNMIKQEITKSVYRAGIETSISKLVSSLLIDENKMPKYIILDTKENKFGYLDKGKLKVEYGNPFFIDFWSSALRKMADAYNIAENSKDGLLDFLEAEENKDLEEIDEKVYKDLLKRISKLEKKAEKEKLSTTQEIQLKEYHNTKKEYDKHNKKCRRTEAIANSDVDRQIRENNAYCNKYVNGCKSDNLTRKLKPVLKNIQNNAIEQEGNKLIQE
jgi:hypothetical protein